MQIRTIAIALFLLVISSALTAPARAASLILIPSAGTVAKNGVFTVDLMLNASNAPGTHPGLYGGEIVVNFNKTLLTYGAFTLASGLGYFEPVAVSTTGNTQTVRFGFDHAADTGKVGTFSFTAIGNPGSLAQLGLVDGDDFSGSFASYVRTYQRFYPTFTGTQVAIAAVPLPAGVWLLGTAMGALVARRRLRHAAY